MFAPSVTRPDPDNQPHAAAEWRQGWPRVLAAAVGYGTGGAMLLLLGGLFIKPMRDGLGWSTTAVTIMPLVSLVWALCNPFAGAAIDRVGSRRIAILGMLGLALCTALLGLIPITVTRLFLVAALMGAFASMTSVAAYSRGIASWFKRSFGLALGIALSGSAAVAVIATPAIGTIIAGYGWRAGYLALTAVILLVALPIVVALYRENPGADALDRPKASSVGSSLAGAVRDPRFWCYSCSFTLACIAVSGTATHLQPLLAAKSFALPESLGLGVAFAAAISIGKIAGGMLLDRHWPFAVACGISFVAAAGALGLATVDNSTPFFVMVLAVGAIGMAAGAEADFVGFFGIRSFGLRHFSSIVGLLGMIVTLGNALGGWLYGALFDRYGTYDLACLAGASCLVAAGLVILLAGFFERRAGALLAAGGGRSAEPERSVVVGKSVRLD